MRPGHYMLSYHQNLGVKSNKEEGVSAMQIFHVGFHGQNDAGAVEHGFSAKADFNTQTKAFLKYLLASSETSSSDNMVGGGTKTRTKLWVTQSALGVPVDEGNQTVASHSPLIFTGQDSPRMAGMYRLLYTVQGVPAAVSRSFFVG